MGRIYVAGPMQGIKDFNFDAFHWAARKLRMAGWTVFSPAERDQDKYGKDMNKSEQGNLKDTASSGFDLREAMEADLVWICRNADAVYMLQGWENSKGAQAEWAAARCLGLKIFYERDEENLTWKV